MYTIIRDTLFLASRARLHNNLPRVGGESESQMMLREMREATQNKRWEDYNS